MDVSCYFLLLIIIIVIIIIMFMCITSSINVITYDAMFD